MNDNGNGRRWQAVSTSQLPLRHAICMVCGWSTEPWTGTREQAIDHVERTGHTVDWHHGIQETFNPITPVAPAPDGHDPETGPPPQPTDQGSLVAYIGRTWPQKSFAEGIDQLAGIAYCTDSGLLAMADQAAAYVRDRARARDVRVGARWITRRNWIKLAALAYTSAAVLAAGVAVLLGHVLALGSYPTVP